MKDTEVLYALDVLTYVVTMVLGHMINNIDKDIMEDDAFWHKLEEDCRFLLEPIIEVKG